jgi:hypothetical protein
MNETLDMMLQSLDAVWLEMTAFLPRVFVALVLLIVIRVLRLIRLDVAAERAGIEDFLLQGGVRMTAVTILANLIYWFFLLTVILAALNSLGLPAAAEMLNRVVLYVPNVIIATLLLLFGSLLGRFVRGAVFTYLNNIGIEGATFISHVAQWAIVIFVLSIALEQLSIGGEILVSAFQIAFGALCLALALAFGLGGRRWAADVLDKLWKK